MKFLQSLDKLGGILGNITKPKSSQVETDKLVVHMALQTFFKGKFLQT